MEVTQDAYKDTKIGRIPKDWKVIKFSEVFDFIKTSSHSKNQMVYLKTDSEIYNVHYGAIHTTYKEQILDFKKYNVPRITDDSKMPRKDQFLKDGDLVIVDASEDWDGMGECVELKNIGDKKVIGGLHTYAVRDRNNLFTKGFTGYIFQNTAVRNKLASFANVSKVYGITKGNISNVSLVIPPLREQQKIAEILSTVDEQISATDKIIEKSKELKKGLMQKLFSEGIGHTEFKDTKIGRIPKDWEVDKLKSICIKSSKKFEPKKSDKQRKYIGLEHIAPREHRINGWGNSIESLSTKSVFTTGNILYGKLRPNLDKVWKASFSGVCSTEILVFQANKKTISDFLNYILQRRVFIDYTICRTEGTSLPRANWKDISMFELALPPIIEQQKIVDILLEVDAKIEKEQSQKAQLENLKKGLMQQLLTGKKRVVV